MTVRNFLDMTINADDTQFQIVNSTTDTNVWGGDGCSLDCKGDLMCATVNAIEFDTWGEVVIIYCPLGEWYSCDEDDDEEEDEEDEEVATINPVINGSDGVSW